MHQEQMEKVAQIFDIRQAEYYRKRGHSTINSVSYSSDGTNDGDYTTLLWRIFMLGRFDLCLDIFRFLSDLCFFVALMQWYLSFWITVRPHYHGCWSWMQSFSDCDQWAVTICWGSSVEMSLFLRSQFLTNHKKSERRSKVVIVRSDCCVHLILSSVCRDSRSCILLIVQYFADFIVFFNFCGLSWQCFTQYSVFYYCKYVSWDNVRYNKASLLESDRGHHGWNVRFAIQLLKIVQCTQILYQHFLNFTTQICSVGRGPAFWEMQLWVANYRCHIAPTSGRCFFTDTFLALLKCKQLHEAIEIYLLYNQYIYIYHFQLLQIYNTVGNYRRYALHGSIISIVYPPSCVSIGWWSAR